MSNKVSLFRIMPDTIQGSSDRDARETINAFLKIRHENVPFMTSSDPRRPRFWTEQFPFVHSCAVYDLHLIFIFRTKLRKNRFYK